MLTAEIRHFLCSSTQTFEVKDEINGTWTQLTGAPMLFESPLTFKKGANQINIELSFEQFTALPRQNYTIRCTVVLPVNTLLIVMYDEVFV